MSKIEDSISIINHFIKKKKKRIDEFTRRSTITENEKIFIGDETQMISACEDLIKTFLRDKESYFGKIPPQSLDIEKKVLGAIILQTDAMAKVVSFLSADHFYSDGHKRIYEACAACQPKLDLSLLVMKLREKGQLEASGGAFYLAELIGLVSSAAHIEFHARVLIELAIKREIITVCANALMDGYEDSTDCFELLEETEKGLSKIRAWIK